MALGNAFMINPDKCGKLVAQKVDLFGFGHRSKFRGRTPKRPNPVGQHTSLTRPLDLLGKKRTLQNSRLTSLRRSRLGFLRHCYGWRISTPFITRFFYSLLNGRLWEDEASLARQAVDNMQDRRLIRFPRGRTRLRSDWP